MQFYQPDLLWYDKTFIASSNEVSTVYDNVASLFVSSINNYTACRAKYMRTSMWAKQKAYIPPSRFINGHDTWGGRNVTTVSQVANSSLTHTTVL